MENSLSPLADGSDSSKTSLEMMLNLALAQLLMTKNENDRISGELSGSFTLIAALLDQICSSSEDEHQRLGKDAMDQVSQSIMRFQYYDRLSQRLDHTVFTLSTTIDLLNRADADWSEAISRIQMHYSMAEENSVYEAIVAGKPVSEAIAQSVSAAGDIEAGEIELF